MRHGGTRWRRFGLAAIPAFVAIAALGGMSLLGILPLNLSIAGQPFKLAAHGSATVPQGLDAYASSAPAEPGGPAVPALHARIPEAEIADGVCLSFTLRFPIVGAYTLRVDTTGRTVVKDLRAAATSLQLGNASVDAATSDGRPPAPDGSNVAEPALIGRDAAAYGGTSGMLGVSAPGKTVVGDLQASAVGARLDGTLRINGMRLPKLSSNPYTPCYR